MIYIFDTSSFIVIGHFYRSRFGTFWRDFDTLAANGRMISVREVLRELENQTTRPHLLTWIKERKDLFLPPGSEETRFVSRLFANPHFQQLISAKQRLKGGPAADPWVIASAFAHEACVVTEESEKPNAAKVPNICKHYNIDCVSVERFMEIEDWSY